MKHLLDIKSLSADDINKICIRASEFEKKMRKSNHSNGHVVNMFFENSTRTKLSFEMAENKIFTNKYNFDASVSSINKGEDLYDTVNNLSAIGMNVFVIRHQSNTLINELREKTYYSPVSFINAGSGTSSHPTQALLDYYTLKKHFLDLSEKTVAIVGDIAHSRVAKSNIELLRKFNTKIRCIAPKEFQDESVTGIEYCTDLKEGLENVDVVMALRIQQERIQEKINFEDYIENYQITKENLPYAALLMHPGPVNKDIEIKSDVLFTQNAATILKQAENGVYIRMAILDMILSGQGL